MVEQYAIEVCEDCASLLANGEAFDAEGNDIATELNEMIESVWPNEGDGSWWRLVLDCDEDGQTCDVFTYRQCDGCGSTLGGGRHKAVTMRERAAV